MAKSKDALSLALIGAGVLALAASLGTLYKTYFKKEPWDFCYEKAETILYASEDLQDHLGVDFKVTKYLPGQKNFGDKVVHSEITEIELKKPEAALSPAKFLEQQENEAKDGATAPGETAAENDNLYQTLMINAYIETTISKQILVQATFIKKKSESDSDWFPMVVLVAKDYKNQYKVKQILVCDNRKTIKTEGLDVARTKINADGTKNLSPYEKLELEEKKKTEELKKQIKKQEDEYELFNALGVSNSGSKTSGTNFADLGKIEGEVKQTSDTPSAESARLRPKF